VVMEALLERPAALEALCVWLHETPFIGPSEDEGAEAWDEVERDASNTYVSASRAYNATPAQHHEAYWFLMKFGPLGLVSAIAEGGTHRVHRALARCRHFPQLVDRLLHFASRYAEAEASVDANPDAGVTLPQSGEFCSTAVLWVPSMSITGLWHMCRQLGLPVDAERDGGGSPAAHHPAAIIAKRLRSSPAAQEALRHVKATAESPELAEASGGLLGILDLLDAGEAPAAKTMKVCLACHTRAEKMAACARCSSVCFCSRQCQIRIWKVHHKAFCQAKQ
jgi:hypothetical protein